MAQPVVRNSVELARLVVFAKFWQSDTISNITKITYILW